MAEAYSEERPQSFQIVQATWRDLNPLRQIEKICFPLDAWPLWDLISVLTLPNIVRLKAVMREEMVGFIAGDIRNGQRMSWIATVCVLPEYRGQGIGAALIETCEAQLPFPTVRLNVRTSNENAIRLYRQLGYQKVGLWPGYYQDGEDALIMEKQRL